MQGDQSIDAFLERIRTCEHVSEIWTWALEFLHHRGIKMVSYHSNDAQLPGSEQLGIVADGFPEDWTCHYIEDELFRVDPIPEIAAQIARPFLWSQAPQLGRLDKAAVAYLEELAEAHLGDGLAMQAFGPNLRNAYVGLGFGGPAPDLDSKAIFELQCAVQISHLRYCELTQARQERISALTERELTILRWIARGKSNSVIGDILGISRHTVDTLVRRIFVKLGVNDRTTAAIHGVGSGLLHLERGGFVT